MTDEVNAVFESSTVRHTRKQMPPYSPHLNPIEYMFSKLAAKVREHAPQTTERLIEAVNELCGDGNFVTERDCRHWMEKAKSYYLDCVAGRNLESSWQ